MPTVTPAPIQCSDSAWTLVVENSTNALIRPRSKSGYRVHVGTAAPAVVTENYIYVPADNPTLSLGSLETTDKVYVRGNVLIESLRG